MRIRLNIAISLVFLAMQWSTVQAQKNSGYMGKKVAIGYNSQFSVFRANYISNPPSNRSSLSQVINHDFYLERAASKYTSIAIHYATQTVSHRDIHDNDIANITQDFIIDGEYKTIHFNKTGGYADYKMNALGLKWTFYKKYKTIASPVGFGQYFRIDAFFNKALENHYTYEVNEFAVYPDDEAYIYKNLNRNFSEKTTRTFSFGWGGQAKFPLSSSAFIRVNMETNVSLNLMRNSQDFPNYKDKTIEEDLHFNAKGVPNLRNLFLLGMGFGFLL